MRSDFPHVPASTVQVFLLERARAMDSAPRSELEEASQLAAALAASLASLHLGGAEPEAEPAGAASAGPAAAASSIVHVHVHVEPRRRASPPPAASSRARAEPKAAAAASSPAQGRAGHAYAVWAIPGAPELRGVHADGLEAWQFLLRHLGGGYSYRQGHRLRRFESESEAVRAYESEAARHGAPVPAPRFTHPCPPSNGN